MSPKSSWIRVTKCENIPLREGRAVTVEGTELAVFNLGDRFLAVENRCPHRGGPLSDGIVSGSRVVCPLHAWRVCLEDGTVAKPVGEKACISSYRTKVDEGVVCVQLPPQPHSEMSDDGEDKSRLDSPCVTKPSCAPDLELESAAG